VKQLTTDLQVPERLQGCFFNESSQSSSSQPVLNPQLFNLLDANAQRAAGIANQPFQPYTAPMTAGLTANQQAAGGMFQGASGVGTGALNAGVTTAQNAASYQPSQVTAPTATAATMGSTATAAAPTGLGDISQYMNPYTQSVTDTTLADLDRARQAAITQGQGSATLAGAYGGSRHGVADSLTNQDYLNTAASTLANLNSQGFDTAAGLLQNDQNRTTSNNQFNASAQNATGMFNAGNQQATNLANQSTGLQGLLANQSAGLTANGQNIQAGGLLDTLGNSQSANFLNSTNALNAYGTQEQQTQQSALSAAYQEFMRQQGYDPQMQQLINQALGLVPSALGNSSQSSQSSFGLDNPLSFTKAL
jgi:hypothetical protein